MMVRVKRRGAKIAKRREEQSAQSQARRAKRANSANEAVARGAQWTRGPGARSPARGVSGNDT